MRTGSCEPRWNHSFFFMSVGGKYKVYLLENLFLCTKGLVYGDTFSTTEHPSMHHKALIVVELFDCSIIFLHSQTDLPNQIFSMRFGLCK